MSPARTIDLVLEGGGVKGMALVGAAVALVEEGYRFARIAGSSAGALVGAIMAAMQAADEPMSRVDDIMRTVDYSRWLDRRPVARKLSWWPRAADAWGVLFHLGAHSGRGLEDWVRGVLADLGVGTFADLAFHDPGSALPDSHSFRLVATASDLSRQRLLRIPWDLETYGIEPAGFDVARAVRASTAIPFMFEPVRVPSMFGDVTLADGSLLESYPIGVFDRIDDQQARWPTLGVRLSQPAGEKTLAKPVSGPLSLLTNLIFTTVNSTQVRHVNNPFDVERSIFAKPRGVKWTDFDLTPEQNQRLFDAGYTAAKRWCDRHPEGPPMAAV